ESQIRQSSKSWLINSPFRLWTAELRIATLICSNSAGVAVRKTPFVSGHRSKARSWVSRADLVVLVRVVSFGLVLEKPFFSHSPERPLMQSNESIVFAVTSRS